MYALMVFVYITNDCHRQCDHCYREHNSLVMSKETIDKVTALINKICHEEGVQSYHMAILGGEPLNCPDTILALHDKIDICKNGKILFGKGSNVFTNGDLLTKPFLYEIKKRHMRIVLNPTYDSLSDISNKLQYIKDICGGGSLAIALNDINMPRLESLTKLAIKHHVHMRINRLYNGGNIPGYVEEYEKQMSHMFDMLLESTWIMWPNWIMESTYPIWSGNKNPYSCGKWLLVIDPDGTIRSCNPDKDTVIGHVDTHNKMSDFKFHQRWSAKNLPECQNCEWITWCQGGCPYTRKLAHGNYDTKTPFCSAFKKLFPKLMALTRRWKMTYGVE